MAAASTPKQNSVGTEDKLEHQEYYHGFRDREDLIWDLCHSGDFIVHAQHVANDIKICVTVMVRKQPRTIHLIAQNGGYKLDLTSEKTIFPMVTTLIRHYMIKRISECPLKKGVKKPAWLVRAVDIKYDPEKDTLGAGNFCSVFKGVLIKDSQSRAAAIKVCHQKDQLTPEQMNDTCKAMLREARLMSHYTHANVIEFLGVSCEHFPIRIVLELCPGGALDSHLKKYNDITELELVLYSFEAARGMRYLHVQKCIHRDLAARNCLISARGVVKIADFGLSKATNDMVQEDEHLTNVPLRWMAPESIARPPVYSFKTDCWSFGVLLFEVFNQGVAPFDQEQNYKKIAKAIRAVQMPEAPKQMPVLVKKIVYEDLWTKNPADRLTFVLIVQILYSYIKESLKDTQLTSEQLVLNRIKGVHRMGFLLETEAEIMTVDEFVDPDRQRRRRKKRLSVSMSKTMSRDDDMMVGRSKAHKSRNTSNTVTGSSISLGNRRRKKTYSKDLKSDTCTNRKRDDSPKGKSEDDHLKDKETVSKESPGKMTE